MKAPRTSSSIFAVLSALALLGTVALTGCSSSDLAGPESIPSEASQVEAIGPASSEDDDPYNNGEGGGSTNDSKINTMPSDD